MHNHVEVEIVREVRKPEVLVTGSSYMIFRKDKRSNIGLGVGTIFKAGHAIVLKKKDRLGLVKLSPSNKGTTNE